MDTAIVETRLTEILREIFNQPHLQYQPGLTAADVEDWDSLAWWLAERQCDSGGLNGRPEKLADVCYSWWVLSSLEVLGRVDWIDRVRLREFILACQDPETGGIADHPNNVGDVYHTFFGVCGLSLLGMLGHESGDPHDVDPVYALPNHVVTRLGLTSTRCVGRGAGAGVA